MDQEITINLPCKLEATLIPSDTSGSHLLNWTVQQLSGVEIHLFDPKVTEHKAICNLPLIVEENGIKVGDKIFVPLLLGGWSIATIERKDVDHCWAEGEYNMFTLEFGKDVRKCWVCSCIINRKGIERIEIGA
mgnify:CR=1 FL=1